MWRWWWWSSERRTMRRRRRQGGVGWWRRLRLRNIIRLRLVILTTCLAFLAILPPLIFHFKLTRYSNQMRLRNCNWLYKPPLVCAHGGDSSKAFPNTMDAYDVALRSHVDCIEIDVSRSSDGFLFALHDRELQRLSGNSSLSVGHLSRRKIKELDLTHQFSSAFLDASIPTLEDALKFISGSVRQVILDAKVGPPLYEKGLAQDILSVLDRTDCKNCLVWAKSDNLARDLKKLSPDLMVGYIVMIDPSTGSKTSLLRMKDAGVVGIYHPLIDKRTVTLLHRRNKRVYAWTVDDEAAMRKMLNEQVDAVVTSNPSLLQRLMQDVRRKCTEQGFSLAS